MSDWRTRFPMVVHLCPACGDLLRGPDAAGPYFCQGVEGFDQHEVIQMWRMVLAPVEFAQGESSGDELVDGAPVAKGSGGSG